MFDYTVIKQVLEWLISVPGCIMATSWIFERWSLFQDKTPDQKEWLFFGVASVLAIGGLLGVTYLPQDIINAIGPYFAAISGIFVSVIVGKKFHQEDKK